MIDLVVTDLDGTFWSFQREVSLETSAAFHKLQRGGVPVLAATARNPWVTFEGLAMAGVGMPAVMLNGSIGQDVDRSTFFRSCFEPEQSALVLDAYRQNGLSPQMFVDHPSMLLLRDELHSSCKTYQEFSRPWKTTLDLDVAASELNVLQFGATGIPFEQLLPAKEVIDRIPGLQAFLMKEASFGGGHTLMVTPVQAGKWSSVVAYCELGGLDSNNILAVGDSENDIDLLRRAKISVAMPNAVPAVVAVADHVLTDDVGWAGILELLDD